MVSLNGRKLNRKCIRMECDANFILLGSCLHIELDISIKVKYQKFLMCRLKEVMGSGMSFTENGICKLKYDVGGFTAFCLYYRSNVNPHLRLFLSFLELDY